MSRHFALMACAALMLVGFSAGASARGMGYGMMGPAGQQGFSVNGDAKLGQQIASQTCAACHSADGNSTDPQYPKLAGQNADYLYAQLVAFGDGTRKSDIMSAVATTLSDEDKANVAVFYSTKAPKPDKVSDAKAVARGKAIFFANGGPGVPACAMCHGGQGVGPMMGGGMMGGGMMGMMGGGPIPVLDGQHAAYLLAQLNRFADGERSSQPMSDIAASLSAEDRAAVADYLASTP
jgi:cytochrome c553